MQVERGTGLTRAKALLESGKPEEARRILEAAAAANDGQAALFLGTSFLSGRVFARNLVQAKTYFERAAALGSDKALDVIIAFTANGTGCTRNWEASLAMLRKYLDRNDDYQRQTHLIDSMNIDEDGNPLVEANAERLAGLPGAMLFPAFLSADECDYLVTISQARFKPSVVIHPQTAQLVADPIRISDNTTFPLARESPVIHAINRRIASATSTDVCRGEPLQVLRYSERQQYKLHSDALSETDNQRVMTFLIYLNEGYDGGATEFPQMRFHFRGRTGDALLFSNADNDDKPDMRFIHAGLPVTRGVKYLASRWIRAKAIDLNASPSS